MRRKDPHIPETRRRAHRSARALLAVTLLLGSGAAVAQESQTEASPELEATAPQAIDQRLAQARKELEPIQARVDASSAEVVGAEDLLAQRNLLQQIIEVLEQELKVAEEQTESAPAAAPAPAAADAISIVSLELLYRKLGEEESRRRALQTALNASETSLSKARERLADAETRRRQVRDQVEKANTPEEASEAQQRLAQAVLESRLAGERVHLQELEHGVAQAELAKHDARTALLQGRIAALRNELASGKQSDAETLADLTRVEGELQRSLRALKRQLKGISVEVETARRRLAESTQRSPEREERLRGLELRLELTEEQIALTKARLERLQLRRSYLDQWARVLAQTASRADLREWEAAAEALEEGIRNDALQAEGRITDLEERADAVAARLELAQERTVRASLEAQRDALDELTELHARNQRSLAASRTLVSRFLADVREETGYLSPSELLAEAAAKARDTYSYELAVVSDEPITVGTVILAMALVAVGFVVSRRVSDLLGRTARERFSIETGAAAAIQTLAFYALLIGSGLLALRMVNFPLTAFTVLGGALAIGVGFGSQNVMNNFISGLILMLERPIRSGDLVELSTGTMGMVETIGARSTRIRAGDSKHIIVPNSFFLENSVVNWTLSDDLIRAHVNVGVIYGSPTREVEKLIRDVLKENPKVLTNPQPLVIFAEFGDNSLNFVVYFWTRVRSPMQLASVESEVRFRIDDLFREAGLVIAFPQRDVHLDTVSPIEVRMVDGTAKAREDRS